MRIVLKQFYLFEKKNYFNLIRHIFIRTAPESIIDLELNHPDTHFLCLDKRYYNEYPRFHLCTNGTMPDTVAKRLQQLKHTTLSEVKFKNLDEEAIQLSFYDKNGRKNKYFTMKNRNELIERAQDIEMKNIFMFVRVKNEINFFENVQPKINTIERAVFLAHFRNVHRSELILRTQEVRKLGFKLKIDKDVMTQKQHNYFRCSKNPKCPRSCYVTFFEGLIRYSNLTGKHNHRV